MMAHLRCLVKMETLDQSIGNMPANDKA